MQIGPLNQRARIEYPTITADPVYGSPVTAWTVLDTRWCGLQDVLPSRSEAVRQGLNIALSQTRLRMRFCTDIDSTMRFVINRPTPTVYNIVSGPAELGMKEGIEFMIEKVTT